MSIQYTADQLQRKFPGPGAPGFPRLADVLRGEGKLEEAIQVCQDGLRVRPNTLSAYLVLGKSFMDAGRMEEAREPFEAALRLDPRCLSAMHFLARIMTKLQWADAAAGYYKSILEVEPWDREIRALLGEASPLTAMPSAASTPAAREEETFAKPEGFAGDVLEVNLNDVASDFLPGDSDASGSMSLIEESLEDALSPLPDEFGSLPPAGAVGLESALQPPPANFREPSMEDTRKSLVPDALAEPKPMDVLKEEPIDERGEPAEDAPPISGQDVEDRLDSLFGSDDGPTSSSRSGTATWTPAPAESPVQEAPVPIDFSAAEPYAPESSATATGEMRVMDGGETPAGSEPDFLGNETAMQAAAGTPSEPSPIDMASLPDLPTADDLESGVEFVTPPPASGRTDGSRPGEMDESGGVLGEDIERRLDELFNLTEEGDLVPPSAQVSSRLPVAPAPRVQESVSMGEVVSFGGEVAFREPGYLPEPGQDLVTGQDVADKLDSLFGEEPALAAKSPGSAIVGEDAVPAFPAESAPEAEAEMPLAGPETSSAEEPDGTRFGAGTGSLPMDASQTETLREMKPWAQDNGTPPPPPTGDVMSTESMLPPGWFGDAGDGPSITGADVEEQLDKLFRIEEEGETFRPKGLLPGRDPVNAGDTVTFGTPGPDDRGGNAGKPAPGDESDLTVIMPAMGDPSLREARVPKDAGRIKESVAEWLARQSEDADQRSAVPASGMDAGDTMFLPNEDLAALGDETDSFGTLAPEDLAALSDTASIEMVDGAEVAERLDALFAEAGGDAAAAATTGAEMSLFVSEEDAAAGAGADGFGSPTETGVPAGMDTEEELPPITGSTKPVDKPTPDLAPMLDEEDGYPEEEEMPSGTGAGANVATVTLAEIYFQQGLREQALQIYRQLMEREPENESVRKRIEEIESAKPEGGAGGPGSDPRRPRPGLKVPKRKK